MRDLAHGPPLGLPCVAMPRARSLPSSLHELLLGVALTLTGCGDDGGTTAASAASTSATVGTSSGAATTTATATGPGSTADGGTGGGGGSTSTGSTGGAATSTGAASDPSSSSEPLTGGADTTTTTGDDTTGPGSTGEGTTADPPPACPDNGPPPGPAARKFDVATLNCPGAACPPDQDQCLCPVDFAALNVGPAHFMATGTDNNKPLVWGAGNFQAVYVDDLNTDWMAGGKARADALIAAATANFDCGVPEWFIVNEISASQWPDNATYRQFVIDFAKEMKNTHGKTVVIAAPFAKPGANGASWQALATHAYIAAEIYLSGKEINANGNSVAWCEAQYKAGIDAYGKLGVPLARLFLVEHFGQTTPDKSWGRAGVSTAGWHNAIEARAQAANKLGFAGFISYAWSWNLMHVADDERLAFTGTYVAQSLP